MGQAGGGAIGVLGAGGTCEASEVGRGGGFFDKDLQKLE